MKQSKGRKIPSGEHAKKWYFMGLKHGLMNLRALPAMKMEKYIGGNIPHNSVVFTRNHLRKQIIKEVKEGK